MRFFATKSGHGIRFLEPYLCRNECELCKECKVWTVGVVVRNSDSKGAMGENPLAIARTDVGC